MVFYFSFPWFFLFFALSFRSKAVVSKQSMDSRRLACASGAEGQGGVLFLRSSLISLFFPFASTVDWRVLSFDFLSFFLCMLLLLYLCIFIAVFCRTLSQSSLALEVFVGSVKFSQSLQSPHRVQSSRRALLKPS